MLGKALCLAAILTMSHVPTAESQQAVDSRAAFQRLTRLTGTWSMPARSGSRAVTTYRLSDDGNVLTPDEAGQLTMFRLDGDKLTLTHYCAVGNQPRMRLHALHNGKIAFTMYDIASLSHPQAYHRPIWTWCS